MSAKTRVVVVDDHPLMRKGLAQLIGMAAGMSLVGEAASGADALPLVAEQRPDMVILDLKMAGMNGIETLKALRAAGCQAQLVMHTVSDNHDDLARALDAGADGYLLKDMEPEALLDALQEIRDGQRVVSPQLAASALPAGTTSPVNTELLTEREKQIIDLIGSGHSNKLIARQLDIAEATVKVHVKHLLKKLGMRSRVEVAIWVVGRTR